MADVVGMLHGDDLRRGGCDAWQGKVSVPEAAQDSNRLFELCCRPNSQLPPSSLGEQQSLSWDCVVGGGRTT